MSKQRKGLSAAVLAAIGTGAVPLPSEPTPGAEATPETPPVQPAAEASGTGDGITLEVPAAESAVTEPAAPAAPAAQGESLTGYLQGELAAARTALETARTELAAERGKAQAAETALASANANVAALDAVVREASQRLAVGLGSTVLGLEHLSGVSLVDQYKQLTAKFMQTFPAGRVSSDAQAESPATKAPPVRKTTAVSLTTSTR